MNPKLLPDAMYEFNSPPYSGVFMPKHVMEKIAKAAHKHAQNIREILTAHKDELHPMHWTMATADGVPATYIKFVISGDERASVDRRISLFKTPVPERLDEVFIVDTYEEAEAIAVAKRDGLLHD